MSGLGSVFYISNLGVGKSDENTVGLELGSGGTGSSPHLSPAMGFHDFEMLWGKFSSQLGGCVP